MTPIEDITRDWAQRRVYGGYDVIVADPPWRFANWSKKGEVKNAAAHYDCQPLDWIKALPVSMLGAESCLLFLWATNPMLPQAFEVMDAWGFRFKTAGHWVKTTKHGKLAFGTGYVLRTSGEPFLIGVRGKGIKTSRSVRSVIMGRAREHSRKPDEAITAIENLVPNARRIELFSREARPGWDAWGNETGKFGGAS